MPANYMKPSALLFDLGSTIIRHTDNMVVGNQYLYSIAENPHAVPFDEVQTFIDKLSAELYPPINAPLYEVNWITFNRLLLDRFGMRFTIPLEQAEREFFLQSTIWKPAPGIGRLLSLLKRISIPAGILSNTVWSSSLVCEQLKKLGLLDYFNFVMTSSEYGLRKPHPELFRVAASRCGFRPEKIWFIGDNYTIDVLGSRSIGMHSFQYTGITGRSDGSLEETIGNWESLYILLET